MTAAHARVVRDGKRESVAAAEVVPGDVIIVEEGDTVPADARLVRSAALQTAESALTGESLPVSKDTRPVAADAVLGDRHGLAAGRCRMKREAFRPVPPRAAHALGRLGAADPSLS